MTPASPGRSVRGTIVRQSFWTFAVKGLGFALTLGSGILIARLLGPEGKGVYGLATTLPKIVATVGTLGLSYSCIRLLSNATVSRRAVVSTVLTWALGWGALLVAACWLAYGLLADTFLKGVSPLIYGLGLLIIPVYLLNEGAGQSLRAIKRISDFNLNWLLQFALRFAGLWLALAVWGLGVGGALAARLAGSVVPLAISLVVLYQVVPFRLRIDRAILRDVIGFGLRLSVTHSLLVLNYDIDLFIVNYYSSSTEQVGYYALATSIAELIWYVSESVMVVVLPYIASAARPDQAHMAATACRNALALTVLAALVLAAIARPAIALVYGEEFLPAAVPFLVLLPGTVVMVVFRVLYDFLLLHYNPLRLAIATGSATVLNVAANLVLVPRLGISGASLASVISYTAMSAVALYLFRQNARIPLREIVVPTAADWQEYRRFVARVVRVIGAG